MSTMAGPSSSDVIKRWGTGTPVAIQRPSNDIRIPQGPPPTASRSQNPRNRPIRLQNGTKAVGNTSLHNPPSILRASCSAPPPQKRQRVDSYASTSAMPLSSSRALLPRTAATREGLRFAPESDVEDVPLDEMDIISSNDPKRPSKYSFASDKWPESSTRALTMPREGEAYKELEARYTDLSDPIEDYSDDRGVSVKRLVQIIENGPEPQYPRVDFRHSLKQGMKGKSRRELSLIKSIKVNDTERIQPHHIPVCTCYVNHKLYKSTSLQKMVMYHDLGEVFIKEKNQMHWRSSLLDEHYTLTLGESTKGEQNPVIQFQPQDPMTQPTVTVQLDTKDQAWNENQYIHFLQQIEKQGVKKLLMRNTKPLWEAAEQNAQSSQDVDVKQNRRVLRKRETKEEPLSSRQDESTTLNPGKRKALDVEVPLSNSTGTSVMREVRIREFPKRELRSTQRTLRSTSKATADDEVEVVDFQLENADEVILSYPAGLPGAVNITNADLTRLKPGQFLNDTLIEFGLKVWLRELEGSNPVLASQIHVFNSFFYKKLNSRDPQVGYESVRKWTSKIDIFSKKYVVVPINENFHWYLAIICAPKHILEFVPSTVSNTSRPQTRQSATRLNPSHSEDHPTRDASLETHIEELEVEHDLQNFNASCSIDEREEKRGQYDNLFGKDPPSPMMDVVMSSPDQLDVISDKTSASPTPSTRGQSSNQRALSAPDDMIVDISDSPPRASSLHSATNNGRGIPPLVFYQSSSRKKPSSKKRARDDSDPPSVDDKDSPDEVVLPDVPSTYIFTFDSLGARHPQAVKKLSTYLRMEAKDKKGIEEAGLAVGKNALVPAQGNFCDCGIYLLHFAATFLKNPDHYTNVVLTSTARTVPIQERSKIWREEEILNNTGREVLTSRVLTLSEQWKKDREVAKERTSVDNVEKGNDSEGEVELVESDLGKKSKHKERAKTGPATRVRG